MVLRAVDVETLIESDHPARSIWDLVGRLNLDLFYGCIRSLEGGVGRSAFDPHLLICIWIYAYSRGIGSAREIARLCEIDSAFQWLTGLETINHHTLSDFRVDNREALDELFTQVLGLLSHEGLITLERLMQDGTKVRALAAGNSFAKEERIRQHLETARQHVRDMGAAEQEAGADRTQARVRAARDRVNRLEEHWTRSKSCGLPRWKTKRIMSPGLAQLTPRHE